MFLAVFIYFIIRFVPHVIIHYVLCIHLECSYLDVCSLVVIAGYTYVFDLIQKRINN